MKNLIEIEGYVTSKTWAWDLDTLFRLCHYPLPLSSGEQRPKGIYVTVRVPGSVLNGIPIGVKPQQRLIVTGQLVSRDYIHSLADFMTRARMRGEADGDGPSKIPHVDWPFDPTELIELRSLNEILATALRVVSDPTAAALPAQRRERRRGLRKSGRTQAQPGQTDPADQVERMLYLGGGEARVVTLPAGPVAVSDSAPVPLTWPAISVSST